MLSNLKILDFSTLLPGPFATLLLSDLGADVIHVQRPNSTMGTPADRYLTRSKRQIALDLKEDQAVEKIKELILEYDIILEQFRPGVMQRLGLGYDQLREINPGLIYCSLTGYGQTGPYRDRAGHDNNYLSIAGVASYSGTRKDGPAKQGTQIADLAGGSLHAAIGLLSAFIYRERTGKGQALDISMTDCTFTLNALHARDYLVHDAELNQEELPLNGGSFYDYYQTKDGRYFSVGSLEPKFRKELCEAIGHPDLYAVSISSKREDMELFKQTLKNTFLEKTFSEWKDIFANKECCVEPVLTFSEAVNHPQLVARQMIVNVPTEDGDFEKQLACPIQSNEFEPIYKHVGLQPGANNKEVFTD